MSIYGICLLYIHTIQKKIWITIMVSENNGTITQMLAIVSRKIQKLTNCVPSFLPVKKV